MADPNLQQNIQDTQQLINLNNTLNDILEDQQDLIKNINVELKNQISVNKEINKQYNVLNDITNKLFQTNTSLFDLSKKQLIIDEKRTSKALESSKILKDQLKNEKVLHDLTSKQIENKKQFVNQGEKLSVFLKNVIDLLQNQLQASNNINDKLENHLSLTKELNERYGGLEGIINKINSINENLLDLNKKQLDLEDKRVSRSLESLSLSNSLLENEKKVENFISKQVKGKKQVNELSSFFKLVVTLLRDQLKFSQDISNKLGEQLSLTKELNKQYDGIQTSNESIVDNSDLLLQQTAQQLGFTGANLQNERGILDTLIKQFQTRTNLSKTEQETLSRLIYQRELLKDQRDTLRAINNELQGGLNIKKLSVKQYSILENITDRLLDENESLLDISKSQLEKEEYKAIKALQQLEYGAEYLEQQLINKDLEIDQLERYDELLGANRKLNEQEKSLLRAKQEEFKTEKNAVELIKNRLALQKQINKDLGIHGAAIKSIEKFTSKIGLSGLDDVFKNARIAAENKAKSLYAANSSVSSIRVNLAGAGASMGVLAKGIGKALLDPMFLITAQIALLKKVFDLYKGINQQITEQGRQLGISYKDSEKLYQSALDYAANSKDIYVTQTKILEGRKLLNDALESAIQFSNEESIEAKKLSEFYGLSNEQLKQMNFLSARNNKTIIQTKNEILKTAAIQKSQFGGTLSYQKIVQKVNSISGEILTKFKGNVGALTAAVQQADRLGISLEQVDKVGESLLNFETSIQNELKAELLTGKAINLERARAAALSGDQVKLMNEIVSQVGNIHQFEKMNVIQRQAYAEAFGMTAAEMGDMLRKREFEAKYGKIEQENAQKILDTAKARGETIDTTIKKELEQMSLQEKMKDVFTRLQGILISLVDGPLSKMFSIIEKILNGVVSVAKTFKSMTGGISSDALGTVLLGLPTLLLGARMLTGGIRSLILGPRGSSFANPVHSVVQGFGMGVGQGRGGGMVGPGFYGGKGGPSSIAQQTYLLRQNNPNMSYQKALSKARFNQRFGAGSMGAMGVGLGLGVGGMALGAVADNMDEGAGKNAVGVLGQTATYAGMGMMFGPWGAAIGGLVGLGVGLFNLSKENEERRKQEMEQQKQSEQQTRNMIEALTVRPVRLTVGNKEIGEWNTASQQYSANGFFGNQ